MRHFLKRLSGVALYLAFIGCLFASCGKNEISQTLYRQAEQDAAAGGTQNRELSQKELLGSYKAEERYRYEGLRLDKKEKTALPAMLSLPSLDGTAVTYWLYPDAEMTDGQLLQIAEMKFGTIPEDAFQPKETQISYEELNDLTASILEEYKITDDIIREIYPAYWSASGIDTLVEMADTWNIRVSCRSGYDYEVIVSANDGTLIEWDRKPEGYYDPDTFLQEYQADAPGTFTEEAFVRAAQTYCESCGVADITEYQLSLPVREGTFDFPETKLVLAVTKSGGSHQIFVDTSDLSVAGLILAKAN